MRDDRHSDMEDTVSEVRYKQFTAQRYQIRILPPHNSHVYILLLKISHSLQCSIPQMRLYPDFIFEVKSSEHVIRNCFKM
jgi:hypothetical protein